MEALKNNKRILILLGFYPDEARKSVKMLRLLFSFFIVLAISLGCISSTIYIVLHMKTDLGTSLQATLQLAASSSTAYIMILGVFLRSKILDMLENYQKIHDKSESFFRIIFLF